MNLRRIAATAIRLERHQRRYSRLLQQNLYSPTMRPALAQCWERIKRAERELREHVAALRTPVDDSPGAERVLRVDSQLLEE